MTLGALTWIRGCWQQPNTMGEIRLSLIFSLLLVLNSCTSLMLCLLLCARSIGGQLGFHASVCA